MLFMVDVVANHMVRAYFSIVTGDDIALCPTLDMLEQAVTWTTAFSTLSMLGTISTCLARS